MNIQFILQLYFEFSMQVLDYYSGCKSSFCHQINFCFSQNVHLSVPPHHDDPLAWRKVTVLGIFLDHLVCDFYQCNARHTNTTTHPILMEEYFTGANVRTSITSTKTWCDCAFFCQTKLFRFPTWCFRHQKVWIARAKPTQRALVFQTFWKKTNSLTGACDWRRRKALWNSFFRLVIMTELCFCVIEEEKLQCRCSIMICFSSPSLYPRLPVLKRCSYDMCECSNNPNNTSAWTLCKREKKRKLRLTRPTSSEQARCIAREKEK